MLRYLARVQSLSYEFISLIAEALGLPPNGLAHFYDNDSVMQHRAKVRIKCTYVGLRVYGGDARRHQDRQVSVFRRRGFRTGCWAAL